MKTKPRLNLEVSPEMYAEIQQFAADGHTTLANVFRVAFSLYKVCHQAKKDGHHVGVARDSKRLDLEFVGFL